MMGSNSGRRRRKEEGNDQVWAEKGKLISFGLALALGWFGNPLLIQPVLQGWNWNLAQRTAFEGVWATVFGQSSYQDQMWLTDDEYLLMIRKYYQYQHISYCWRAAVELKLLTMMYLDDGRRSQGTEVDKTIPTSHQGIFLSVTALWLSTLF